MDNAYWSIENAGWTSPEGALVTPWSGYDVALPDVVPPVDATAVLRLPSREEVGAAVPAQREQAVETVSR